MINTSYPAETIRDDILPSLNLSVTLAAKQLGISQARFSRILNGQVGINADMALRLQLWLGENGPSAKNWLHLQIKYDLSLAIKNGNFEVQPIDYLYPKVSHHQR